MKVFIMIFALSLISLKVIANNVELSNGEKLDLSSTYGQLNIRYYNTIHSFERKLKECSNSEVVIEKSDFIDIPKSNQEELSTTLVYFDAKTQYDCVENELKNFTLASSMLLALDKGDKQKLDAMNYIVMKLPIMLEKAKKEYLLLPQDLRIKFSKVDKLSKPFNLLETYERLSSF